MSDFDPKYLRAPFLFGKPNEVVSAVVNRFHALGFELRGIGRPGKPPMPWYYFKGQPASEAQIQAGWEKAKEQVLATHPEYADHLI